MADVQKLLKNILSAIYGKDVRQSIHDAIKQCYYDGKAGGNDLEARDRAAAAEARMDTFTSLKNGSTTGDAELMDIRIGLDGTKYGSAGSAVREQIRDTRTIEVSEVEPTRENTVLWINPNDRGTVYLNGMKDGKETTIALDHTIIRVKNKSGVWESLPAISGESVYDMAVRHGYIGTEDEFMEELMSAGWVDAVVQLEEKKLDKEEALSSDTKKLYGLTDDSTLDDLYKELHRSVGTIETTVRKDLGDKWLLCNGSCFNAEQYPELYEVMPLNYATALTNVHDSILLETDHVLGFAYGNGWYVVVGQDMSSDQANIFVCFSNDLVTWTRKVIENPVSTTYTTARFIIRYVNDKFVMVVDCSVYSASNPGDEWTRTVIQDPGIYIPSIYGIAYGNGYYVVSYILTGDSGIIAYTTDISGAWTTYAWNVVGRYGNVRFLNGHFILPCFSGELVHFSSPIYIDTLEVVTVGNSLRDVLYANNTYTVLSAYSGEVRKFMLYTSSDLVNWTPGASVDAVITWWDEAISFINDEYVLLFNRDNRRYIAHTSNPNGEFELTPAIEEGNTFGPTCIFENAVFATNNNYQFMANFRNMLPNISYDKAYAYIKAAE